jgi:GNAT superfamily N-acetyltransferase
MYVRPAVKADHRWRVALLTEHFGSPHFVGHGVVYNAAELPALVCIGSAGDRAGVLSYQIANGQLEIVSIDAETHGHGTGTALLEAAISVARSGGCLERVWKGIRRACVTAARGELIFCGWDRSGGIRRI